MRQVFIYALLFASLAPLRLAYCLDVETEHFKVSLPEAGTRMRFEEAGLLGRHLNAMVKKDVKKGNISEAVFQSGLTKKRGDYRSSGRRSGAKIGIRLLKFQGPGLLRDLSPDEESVDFELSFPDSTSFRAQGLKIRYADQLINVMSAEDDKTYFFPDLEELIIDLVRHAALIRSEEAFLSELRRFRAHLLAQIDVEYHVEQILTLRPPTGGRFDQFAHVEGIHDALPDPDGWNFAWNRTRWREASLLRYLDGIHKYHRLRSNQDWLREYRPFYSCSASLECI